MILIDTPRWTHQIRGIDAAEDKNEFGLFFEMGCGKSRVAIDISRRKFSKAARLLRTLVLAPPITLGNWKSEFEKFSKVGPECHVIYGTGKQRATHLREVATPDDDGHPFGPVPGRKNAILITNYESLLMKEVFALIKRWAPELIIFDELHKLKDMKSKRTKLSIELADESRFRLGLTGTPILNSPLDLFAQFRVLDKGELFGKNFFVFRARYFYDKNAAMPKGRHFPNWQILPGALEDISQKIATKSMTAKKADCLDLPPLVKKTIHVDLSPEQQKIYDDLKKDYIAYIGSEVCVAQLAITKALRLMQVVSGFVTVEGENGSARKNKKLNNPRAEALRDILEATTPNHKVIIWAVFKENYDTIRKVCVDLGLGEGFVEIHGDVSPRLKTEAMERLANDPSCRVLLGHPMSGGIGVNLVSASYSIFYSRNFSLEQDLQAEARNYRGGSEIHTKITRIDLVAKNTIDELITKRLANKLEISDKVLLDLAKEL